MESPSRWVRKLAGVAGWLLCRFTGRPSRSYQRLPKRPQLAGYLSLNSVGGRTAPRVGTIIAESAATGESVWSFVSLIRTCIWRLTRFDCCGDPGQSQASPASTRILGRERPALLGIHIDDGPAQRTHPAEVAADSGRRKTDSRGQCSGVSRRECRIIIGFLPSFHRQADKVRVLAAVATKLMTACRLAEQLWDHVAVAYQCDRSTGLGIELHFWIDAQVGIE